MLHCYVDNVGEIWQKNIERRLPEPKRSFQLADTSTERRSVYYPSLNRDRFILVEPFFHCMNLEL